MDKTNIAGVVLAGGKSSRMGQSKALLDYNGAPLLDHMIGVLNKTGLAEVFVSGEFDGYHCIPDATPYEGPARAIAHIMGVLKAYAGVLFIPVDMPFLTPKILNHLLSQKKDAYFENHPLPAFIERSDVSLNCSAVHELLKILDISHITLPEEFKKQMKNANNFKEWKEILDT
jgi:molybdopterin-guanine dinucleotide biosynthesis protein A